MINGANCANRPAGEQCGMVIGRRQYFDLCQGHGLLCHHLGGHPLSKPSS